MQFLPSCFYVTFQNYRDRSVEFTIKCVFISSEPVNGRFLRHVLTLLPPTRYSSTKNNFSRIMNLCTPSRMNDISISPEAVQYDSFVSASDRELYRYEYGFITAEDKRRFTRALDHYGICYDFTTLLDDLPF